jgi:adenine-specific DNA-methyltransferase
LALLIRECRHELHEEADGIAFARAVCLAALARYRATLPGAAPDALAHAGARFGLPGLPDSARRAAEALGTEMASSPKPVAAYLLSTSYTTLLPEHYRARFGVYYTPPPLVERLLDVLEEAGADWARHTVLDPAGGGGAFAAPVAGRMAERLATLGRSADAILDHIATHLTAVEVDPFSAWMGNVLLEIALWDYCARARRHAPWVYQVQDALQLPDAWRGGVDVLVGNPPYGKLTLPPELRRRFSRSLYGHANLYGVFTDLALRLIKPGGLLGYVTPTSFLGGQYFTNLRRLLMQEAPPIAIDFLAKRHGVFDRVLQEALLAVFRRGAKPAPIVVHACDMGALTSPARVTTAGEVAAPQAEGQPWLLPRTEEDAALVRSLSRMPTRLADYGLGVSTGPVVWNRVRTQLQQQPGRQRYPLIWAESVRPGGVFRYSADKRNHAPYLEVALGQDALLIGEPVVLVQRTTAKEQAQRLVAALLPLEMLAEHRAVAVENHLNMVRPLSAAARVPLDAVVALLNSSAANRAIRCINGSVAVSAYELESMPVPPVAAMLELSEMLAGGATLEELDSFIDAQYDGPRVDALAQPA